MQYDHISLFRRENGVYYFKLTRDGKPQWKSSGCTTKAAALRALRGLETAPSGNNGTAVTFEGFRELLLAFTANNYAPHTHELYTLALRRLEELFPGVRPDRFTARHADEFKLWRLKSVSPVTVNVELRTLRAAFNHAVRWGVLTENPFRSVKQVHIPERVPPYFRPGDLRVLLEHIYADWLRDIVTVAVSTGLRQGELIHLCWEQVSLDRRFIRVESVGRFQTKAGRSRVVPLNDKALIVLRRRWEAHEHDELVFTLQGREIRRDTLTHRFKAAVRTARLPEHLHFHSLRHTFASWLVQDGVSLYQVGRLLGHTTARTTEVYAHLQPETMHDVVDRLDLGDLP